MSLKKNREIMFPEVEDWSKPYYKYTNEKDVNKLTYKQWFWFHPTAYNLIYYGFPINGIVIFTLTTGYFVQIGVWIGAVLTSLILLSLIISLFRKFIRRKENKGMTFYDLFLRDF